MMTGWKKICSFIVDWLLESQLYLPIRELAAWYEGRNNTTERLSAQSRQKPPTWLRQRQWQRRRPEGQITQYILQSSWATVRLHMWQSGLQRWSALRFPVGQDEYEGIQICDHVKFEGPVGHLGGADLQRWPDTERCGHKKTVILERWGHPDGHHQRSGSSGLLYWQCTMEECYDILNKTERLASWILLQRLLQSDL